MDTGRDGVSVSIISNMLNKIGFDVSYYRLSEIDLENNALSTCNSSYEKESLFIS